MKHTTKRFALGTLVAAVSGYVAGVLTAPKSGKETRKDIKDAAVKGKSEAEKQLKKLHTELGDVIDQAKTRADQAKGKVKGELDSAIDVTKAAKEKVREILSAVHEGDAEDKELKKAIAEAAKAVDHLKTYLTKRD